MGNNEIPSSSCENVNTNKETPEIADTFNWSREEREKLNKEILIEELRQKLIEKYPEQRCFFESAEIRVMQLGDNIEEYNKIKKQLGTDIFVLFGANGKLLSYLDKDGNTMFDVSNFNFDNDFKNLLLKKKFDSFIFRNIEDGKLKLSEKGNVFEEGSIEFNKQIYFHFLPLLRYLIPNQNN